MALTTTSTLAFGAFETQLKTLCLKEFPCGIGSWRENSGKASQALQLNKTNSNFIVTLRDYGASHEKTEALEELISEKRSPWNLDYSWSDEAKQLREIAVKSPWLIDEKFVLGHFRTLRIVDKEVTEVDKNFLRFTNLEELTLSANFLQTVNSCNLPENLKVLELCANRVSNLADLCLSPPPLTHLGLGHNLLVMTDDYLTGDYWPHLLSLDLSHNNLCDLMDIVRKLQTLPKLRNLLMQGNPLALVPAYRGYVIDSLRNLAFLDDISISADEKHHYKGLARRKEYILDEAKVVFSVDYIKGLMAPDEIKNKDDQPEFPIVTRKYYIQFLYLEDSSANAEIFQILHGDGLSLVSGTQQTEDAQTVQTTQESVAPASVTHGTEAESVMDGTARSVNFSDAVNTVLPIKDPQPEITEVPEDIFLTERSEESSRKVQEDEQSCSESQDPEDPFARIRLAPLNSESATWAENIELNWSKMVARDDLLSLRNFLKEGIEIMVMEEKVLSYPADQMQDGMISPQGSQKSKDKVKGDKKDKKDDKKKEDDGKAKKKKKGEPAIDLVHMPAEYTTIAMFHAQLDHFLDGEFIYENVYVKEWETDDGGLDQIMEKGSTHKEKKDKKKEKPGSGKKKDGKDTPKPGKADKKGDKDKGGKGRKASVADMGDDDVPPPPAPLEVSIGITLHHWKTAMDSLKDQKQPNSNQEENSQK